MSCHSIFEIVDLGVDLVDGHEYVRHARQAKLAVDLGEQRAVRVSDVNMSLQRQQSAQGVAEL